MAIISRTNSKVIKDPLFTPVLKFLKERIAQLEIDDPDDELELARQRYTGLIAGDLVIEDPIAFPDNITRVCIVSRKTGFARADVEVKRVTVKEVLEDFAVPFVEINTVEELKTFAKAAPVEATLLWLNYANTYGVMLNQDNAKTMSGMQKAFGDLFFNTFTSTRESLTAIDYDTLESGTVKVTDPAFGMGEYPLFIYELVKAEADLPEITSNLPTEITSSRGKDFSIPNTYWFGGVEDITLTAQVDLSTDSGYTIPRRSDDKLELEGETIFGSSDKEVTDYIVVRVTHMYMGRPVRKTFRIKVIIEQDEQLDLTFEVTPAQITSTSGDVVEVAVKAFFQGAQVKLNVPATKFESKKRYGDLTYVSSQPDGTMIYRGTIGGTLPSGKDQDTELYQAEFQYTDSGTLYKAPAYVNMTVVRPEAKPVFTIVTLTRNVRGFKDDEGVMLVEGHYGKPDDEDYIVISPNDMNISLGVKGTERLIEYTAVTEEGIQYTILRDSGIDGQSVNDTFKQQFVYVDPQGVRYTREYNINVEARRKSSYQVQPGPTPLNVKRYQSGGLPFNFVLNGTVQNDKVTGLKVIEENDYIVTEPLISNRWRTVKAETDKDVPLTVKFEFFVVIDGVRTRFEFDQDFVVLKYTSGDNGGPEDEPGENTNIVAVDPLLTASGKTDETGKYEFKVFEGATDISQQVTIVDLNSVIPAQLLFAALKFNEDTGFLELDYTMIKSGKGKGRIALAKSGVVNPAPAERAVISIDADIAQSRTFKVIEWPNDLRGNVEENLKFMPVFEFAGVNVPLDDPNITITKVGNSDVNIVSAGSDYLEVVDNYWRFAGRDYLTSTLLEIVYTDPLNSSNVTTIRRSMAVTIVFPAITLEYDKEEINAKIWDTGTLPIKLMAGTKDWTSATLNVVVLSPNKYISLNRYNWSVVWAELTETTTTLPIRIDWRLNESSGSFTTDAVFNLEAWDQITFGIDYNPHELDLQSGQAGEITASFVYKGQDITDQVELVRSSSTIPETFIFANDGAYDSARNLFVLNYTSTRGGDYPMNLVFKRTAGSETISAPIDTKVTWPDGLNIVKYGGNIRGFYLDEIEYPLEINISGQPLELTSPNIQVIFSSGTGEPISMEEIREKSLLLSLNEGGDEGKDYNYPVTLIVIYTDVATGTPQQWDVDLDGTIRISEVKIGANPKESVKVYDSGLLRVTLTDERNRLVTIEEYLPRGTNPYVAFEGPEGWYVSQGSRIEPVEASLPLTLRYMNGGLMRSIDTSVLFTIAKFDGIDFKGEVVPEKLEGKAGVSGDLKFSFTYKGKPYTDTVLDDTKSSIPLNLATLPFDPETGAVTYTLVGQADDNAKFVFKMATAGTTPVEGVDQVTFNVPVKTTSSDEVFTLGNHSDSVDVLWKGRDLLLIAMKYGEYDLPANAPGLKYKVTGLNGAGDNYVAVTTKTKDGIYIRGDRSNIPGGVENFSFKLDIEYEVGAPTPKTASFNFDVKITMGQVVITNNDDFRTANIWDKGSFWQGLKTDESGIAIDHFELDDPNNKYVELTLPRGYEIIGAEPATSRQLIPMKAFYKVDAVTELQSVAFNADFNIIGSTSVRFKVTPTPVRIETALDVDTTISLLPIYKDQRVGSRAIFKEELSTIPEQVEIKSHRVNGDVHEIVFTGKKGGLGTAELVFWSPDAGTDPKPRDVVKVTMDTRVLGELVLEIGDRDNLLTGAHLDTGTYKLEVLFGLLPIDISDEISKGNLTITREAGALTLPNAFVLNPTTWHADAFDYELRGPVAPGQTVNVSDFLNVTYKFGGTNYTRRVEIPLRYTTPAPTAISGNTIGTAAAPVNMWSTRTMSPSLSCAGTTITSTTYPLQRLTYTDAGEGPYIKITNELTRQTSVEGSTPTGLVGEVIPFRFYSTYRNWEYQADVDFTCWVAAWDGRTFYVNFVQGTENAAPNVDTDFVFRIQQFYRGVQSYVDLIDYDLTDFDGLIDIKSAVNEGFSGSTWTKYTAHAAEPGQKAIPITFRRTGGANPGELNLDYDVATLTVDIKVPALTISGFTQPVLGGNQDKVSAGSPKVELLGTNIFLNNSNMTIVLENQNAIKIDSITTNALTYEVTAPLSTAVDTIIGTKLTFTYRSPSTGRTHTGEFTQNLKYRQPADYPKWAANGTYRVDAAFVPTPSGNIFPITANGVDISSQVKPISVVPSVQDGGWFIINPDWPEDSANQFFTTGRLPGEVLNYRYHTITFEVPFRGTMIQGTRLVDTSCFLAATQHFMANPTSFNQETAVAGVEFEIPFKLLQYGKAYVNGFLNLTESTTTVGREPLSKYLEYVSTRNDGTTTFVKFKTLISYNGVMNFVWYTKDGIPVAEQKDYINRTNVAVTLIPALSTVPNVGDPKQIFRRYNLPFKVMSGTTDITETDIQLISVAGPNGVVYTSDAATPTAQARTNLGAAGSAGGTWGGVTFGKGPSWGILVADTVASEMEFTFKIRTSATYGSKDLTVVQKVPTAAWDQIQYKAEVSGLSIMHGNNVGVMDPSVYDNQGNLIIAFPNNLNALATGVINHVGRAISWSIQPNTLVALNTPTSNQAVFSGQSTIPDTGDGIFRVILENPGNPTLTRVRCDKFGEIVGKFRSDWKYTSGSGNVNGYPMGTIDKNSSEIPVRYISFEPVLKWKDDVEPAAVTGKKGDKIKIQTNGLFFGPIKQIGFALTGSETVAITSLNTSLATISTTASDKGLDFFSINVVYDNTGTDFTTDLPIRITWSAAGKTYTFDYNQEITITGTGTVDPVPSIVEITPQSTRMYKTGSAAGFKVEYNGQILTPTYTTIWMTKGASIEPNGYIEYMTSANSIWTCVKADSTEKKLDVKYIFTFTDGVRTFPMEAVVPFTIEAWDGNDLRVTNFSGASPNKAAWNQSAGMSLLFEYKGRAVSMNVLTNWDIPKAEFELLNPGLQFVSKSYNSPSNWGSLSFRAVANFTGHVIYPLYYTGAGADPDPQKNRLLIEDTTYFIGYEEKLYWLPDDIQPTQVEGAYDDVVDIPIPLSMGLNMTDNPIPGTITVANSMGLSVLSNQLLVEPFKTAYPVTLTAAKIHILADNRGADQVVDVEMRVSLTFYNSRVVNATKQWTQKVLIKGSGVGDTTIANNINTVTGNVWNTGALPFSINHNGSQVAANQYKSITVKDNPYVRTNPNYTSGVNNAYEIYFGELTGNTAVVTFVAVFNDGLKDVTVEQDITFNINPYDGREFIISLRSPGAWNNGIYAAINGTALYQIWGSYRGKAIARAQYNTQFGVWDSRTVLPGFLSPPISKVDGASSGGGNAGQYLTCTYRAGAEDMQVNEIGKIYFGLVDREFAEDAVENVDYVIVNIPSYVYISDKYYPRSANNTTEIEGRYDANASLKYKLDMPVRRGVTNVYNYATGVSVDFDPRNIIQTDSSNILIGGYNVWFSSELTTEPKKTSDVVVMVGQGTTDKWARFPLKVTQISNLTFPEISNVQDVTAGIGETGPLPFTVMAGSEDYTDRTKVTGVSDNPYIDVLNDKWIVMNAPTEDTEVTVTLKVDVTYATGVVPLEQNVKFTVKAWDGNFVFTDVVSVDAKVWDKGTVLPFKVKAGGTEIPLTWITGMTLVSSNNYVKGGTLYTDNWQVVDGDLTQDVTEQVVYTLTINTGKKTASPTQVVLFNIEKYDGIEYKLVLTEGASGAIIPEGILKLQGAKTGQGFYLKTWYRGELGVGSSRRVSDSVGAGLSGLSLQSGGVTLFYHVDTTQNVNSKSTITINARRDGAVDMDPGKGTTTIVIPTTIYANANYIVVDNTTEIGGKFGEEANVKVLATTSNQLVNLTNPAHTFEFTPNTAVELVPSSVSPTGFKVRFLADVDDPVTTAVTVTFTNSVTNTLKGTFVLNVTQLPSAVPEITDVQDVTAIINDTGDLPFKVMYKGADITADCTLTDISANSYVRKGTDNTWEVYDAARAETVVMPVFTVTHGTGIGMVTLTQAVKFTVKGWTGKLLKPVADDSVGVNGKTGQILISGSFGDGKLYPDTTVNVSSIDGKGIATFTAVAEGTDSGLLLTYTGDAVGTEDITVRVTAVVGSGNDIEGSDFADVTFSLRILPATLTPSADFESDVIGDLYHPAVAKQSTSL